MRPLIFTINSTLDGHCGHASVIADQELHRHITAMLGLVDTVLFGRVTYELLKSHWPAVAASGSGNPAENEFARALEPMPKVVFSKSLRTSDWNTRVVSTDALREVRQLKEQAGKGLLLIASPGLAASLRAAELIDEYRLLLQPMLVSKGPKLFGAAGPDLSLSLASATPLSSGVIDLHYVRRR